MDMPWHVPALYPDINCRVTPWRDPQPGQTKNPGALHQGFFFVAETGEISNQEFFEDICKTVKLIDSEILG